MLIMIFSPVANFGDHPLESRSIGLMYLQVFKKNFWLFATHSFTNFKVKRLKTKIIQQVLPKKCSIISQMISISTLKEPLKCEGRCLCISNICLFSQLKVSKSQMLSSLSSRSSKRMLFSLKV